MSWLDFLAGASLGMAVGAVVMGAVYRRVIDECVIEMYRCAWRLGESAAIQLNQKELVDEIANLCVGVPMVGPAGALAESIIAMIERARDQS